MTRLLILLLIVLAGRFTTSVIAKEVPPPPHSPTPNQWLVGGGELSSPAPTTLTMDSAGVSSEFIGDIGYPPGAIFVTNTVYVIPSNTVIRIQVSDDLTKDDWYEPVVFKSKTQYKHFRVLFETE